LDFIRWKPSPVKAETQPGTGQENPSDKQSQKRREEEILVVKGEEKSIGRTPHF
jgi:hypothetical protein